MIERLGFLALAAAALVLAWFQQSSRIADLRRRDAPLVAILRVSQAPNEGPAPSSTWVLALYSWDRRVLNLVWVGRKMPELAALARNPSWNASVNLPYAFGPPDSPEALKAWIASWPRGLRFWLHWPGLRRRVERAAEPALSPYDACLLAWEFYRLPPAAIRLSWLPKPPQENRLISLLLRPDLGRDEERLPLSARTPAVSVQILNASGEEGVALQATKILRWAKADVVDYGNASVSADRTQIIDRTGDFGAAERIRRTLGCDPEVDILTQIDSQPHAAVTAVLGRNYRLCKAFAAGQGAIPWNSSRY